MRYFLFYVSRRRLESAALTARKGLSDGRRGWAAEKDTLLAAVKEASQRADLFGRERAEAKAYAALLEERLQQTLEREASLNEEVEALTGSARDGERRVARAEADAARVRAAAAAQVAKKTNYKQYDMIETAILQKPTPPTAVVVVVLMWRVVCLALLRIPLGEKSL